MENRVVKVWHIDEMDLKYSNKIISTIKYDGIEISILKSQQNRCNQSLLIKSPGNEYWELGIFLIKFNNFKIAILQKEENTIEKQYCNKIISTYKKFDLKKFWEQVAESEGYFNKCELEYIQRYFPEIYEKVKISRNSFLEKRNNEKIQIINFKKECVEKLNNEFNKNLKELKYKILIGENIVMEMLKFYKDGKYENGITTQNGVLYLASLYGIKIPSATQGFINNRLVAYNFVNKTCTYKITRINKQCSFKIRDYFERIYQKVREEYHVEVENRYKQKIAS